MLEVRICDLSDSESQEDYPVFWYMNSTENIYGLTNKIHRINNSNKCWQVWRKPHLSAKLVIDFTIAGKRGASHACQHLDKNLLVKAL